MSWLRFRRRSTPPGVPGPESPRPWPVDPELSRRVIETRKRVEDMRRELARHVLPERRAKRRT
jgi:hypothetical protein